MQCPVCDYPNTVPQYRMRDRFFESTVEEFVLHYCSSCGLLFLDENRSATWDVSILAAIGGRQTAGVQGWNALTVNG